MEEGAVLIFWSGVKIFKCLVLLPVNAFKWLFLLYKNGMLMAGS